MSRFYDFFKTFLIVALLALVVVFGLKIYYEWSQYKDLSVGQIIENLIDRNDDKTISDVLGDDNVYASLQNTEDNKASDIRQASSFIVAHDVKLDSKSQYLFDQYKSGDLKAERIYQSVMNTGSSKSWILYGDGSLYYIPEVANGAWDMGVLSAIVAARYAADNIDGFEKVYRVKTYNNTWQAFIGLNKIYGSEFFAK